MARNNIIVPLHYTRDAEQHYKNKLKTNAPHISDNTA
jgi:hypothetical protein